MIYGKINSSLTICFCILAILLLSGCVSEQRERRLAKPQEKLMAPYDNGTIFKAGFNERPLFEERRPRNVGDSLIMTVAEIPPAKKAEKKGDDTEETERDRRRERDEELSNIAADALVGDMRMTVIEVLDNGYLLVAGGKQVKVDEDDLFIRVTGVVDPRNISGGNMVSSILVSDVRIQVDDVRIHSDGTAINFSEGQGTFGNNFQSLGH
jgi:flagellar L-ring protein precursor FlgH